MSQHNEQWGQQPQPLAPPTSAPGPGRRLVTSLVSGVGLILFTVAMAIWADRVFYFLPIFGIVIIIQGVVRYSKAKKESPVAVGQDWNQQPPAQQWQQPPAQQWPQPPAPQWPQPPAPQRQDPAQHWQQQPPPNQQSPGSQQPPPWS